MRYLFTALLLTLVACGGSDYESVKKEYEMKVLERELNDLYIQSEYDRLIDLEAADEPYDDSLYNKTKEAIEERKARQPKLQVESDSLHGLMLEKLGEMK